MFYVRSTTIYVFLKIQKSQKSLNKYDISGLSLLNDIIT